MSHKKCRNSSHILSYVAEFKVSPTSFTTGLHPEDTIPLPPLSVTNPLRWSYNANMLQLYYF